MGMAGIPLDGKAGELPRHPSWLPGKTAQFLATALVSLLPFTLGMVIGWPAVAGPVLMRDNGFSLDLVSWGAALPALTSVPGAAFFGRLVESRGRRPAALLVAAVQAVSWTLLLLVPMLQDLGSGHALSAAAMLTSRTLIGLANGGLLVVGPIYLGEVVEDSLRGALSSCLPLTMNTGVLFEFALGAQGNLTLVSLAGGAVPVLFLVLFTFLPETPAYLMSRRDEAGALRSLCWLRDPRRCDVRAELAALRVSGKEDAEDAEDSDGRAATPRELVSTRGSRRGLIIVVGLMLLQQLSGIGAVLSYTIDILQTAGAGDASGGGMVMGAAQLFGSFVACVLADRAGRRPLLFASSAGMAVSMATLAARFCWPDAVPVWLVVPSLSVFVLMYAVGLGCVPFIMMVEVFPPRLRHLSSQIAMLLLSAGTFVVTKCFPLFDSHAVYWIFAAICAAAVPFTWLAVPETKGRPSDHIVAELEGFELKPQSEE